MSRIDLLQMKYHSQIILLSAYFYMLLTPLQMPRASNQQQLIVDMGKYLSKPSPKQHPYNPQLTMAKDINPQSQQIRVQDINPQSQQIRVFSPSEKSEQPVLFISANNKSNLIKVAQQGKLFLMNIPAGRQVALVINYGGKTELVTTVLKGKQTVYQKQKQRETRIYISTIGHCDNLTALMLDWKGQFNSSVFSILLLISSLLAFTTGTPSYQPISDVAEFIPASCSAIEGLRMLNEANTLPQFLWLQAYAVISPFGQELLSFRKDQLSAKKRNLDRELFQQAYTQIRFQIIQQPPYLYSFGKDEEQKKIKLFDFKRKCDQLRVNILKNLKPKTWNEQKLSPKMILALTLQFEESQFYYSNIQSIWKGLPNKLSFLIRMKVTSILSQQKTKLTNEANRRKLLQSLRKDLLPLVREFRSYAFLDQNLFTEFIDNELKEFALSCYDLENDQVEAREHYLNEKTNSVEIDFTLIAERIEQRIKQGKNSVCQILIEENKILESEGSTYPESARLVFQEKLKDFFNQKMREEMARLEKENAVKTEQNVALTTEIQEIKTKLELQRRKSVCQKFEDNKSEFELMSQEEQDSLI